MVKLSIALLLAIQFPNLIAQSTHSSPPDSTKAYEVAIWKMWQIVHMAEQAGTCDSLVRYQEVEINKMLQEQQSADQLLRIRTEELWVTQVEVEKYKGLYENQEKITSVSVQDQKILRNKWAGVGIGATIGGVTLGPVGAGIGAFAGYLAGSALKPRLLPPIGKPP